MNYTFKKYVIELETNINKINKNSKILLFYTFESGNETVIRYLDE